MSPRSRRLAVAAGWLARLAAIGAGIAVFLLLVQNMAVHA